MTSDEINIVDFTSSENCSLAFPVHDHPSIKNAHSSGSQQLLGYHIKKIVHTVKRDLVNERLLQEDSNLEKSSKQSVILENLIMGINLENVPVFKTFYFYFGPVVSLG